ncbi:MAG: DUF433 domain-containing protein [Chloroflexi bacterium]|nr:DUF433 domain-containing protein [Chloroflexota bacterium]
MARSATTRRCSPASVVRNPRVLGGEPTIKGTRIPVRAIVIAMEIYGDLGRVQEAYPCLSARDIQDVLAFYAANRQEIDRYIDENEAAGYA